MKPATSALIALTLLTGALGLSLGSAHREKPKTLVDQTVAAHPNALWHIVHDLCVTDMTASGNPAPCAIVNLAGRYAVLKDIEGATQYLLLPTDRVPGIESPALLAPGSPNYWQASWAARTLFEQKVGHPVPREDVGLAVNSQFGRTQNQLHIHIDCVRRDVRDTLARQAREITGRWSSLTLGPSGVPYRVRWIDGADLGARNPFKLLAAQDPVARGDMSHETLVLIGAARRDGSPGFVLLSDRVDFARGDNAAGEELLDHKCAVLGAPPPA